MTATAEILALARELAPQLSDDDLAELVADWLLAADGKPAERAGVLWFLVTLRDRLIERGHYGQGSVVAGVLSAAYRSAGVP